MMSIFFACALALLSFQDGSLAASIPLFEANNQDNNQIDNSLEVNSGVNYEPVQLSKVRITKELPPTIRRASGARTELECSASGSPAPVIMWLRDNVPITEAEDYENNALIEDSESGVIVAQSRLIIDNFLPVDKVTYTCLARSGSKTDFSTTTVHTTHNGSPKPSSLSEYLLLNQEALAAPAKPRIVSNYQYVLVNQGTTLVLPCKVVGNPRPEVYWMDSANVVVTGQDPRIKVMRSGEMIIQSLRWSDMGLYKCVARNALGKDIENTFVYPMAI